MKLMEWLDSEQKAFAYCFGGSSREINLEKITRANFLRVFINDEPIKTRTIEVPETEEMKGLEKFFVWGQNDFQPKTDCYSLSVGDFLITQDEFYIVDYCGFKRIEHSTLRMALDHKLREIEL